MKTKTILASAMLAAFALNLVAPVVLAGEVEGSPKDTTSTVGFSGGGSTTPGEVTPPAIDEPEIGPTTPDPEQDGTTGPLGLSVPKILDFGMTNTIHSSSTDYFALMSKYTEIKPASPEEDLREYKLPPMIVVKDVRGKLDGAWTLKVAMTKEFTNTGAGKETNVLEGAAITFGDAKVFNSQNPDFSVKAGLTGKTNVTLNPTAATLMTSKDGAGNGESTYVGHSTYAPDTAVEEMAKLDRVDGIKLTVPSKAAGLIEANAKYSADLTWSLTDTPE